ncbi:MAG: exosome complex RNA-binding protein Csl4 [Candidatus Caldarchaeum sp.]|uniref:Exosome complex component Csl4 n=1 Tax=Caldiarchaeum subterraneum TaxID=311458 RepID=A0A7J3VTF9_CALS0
MRKTMVVPGEPVCVIEEFLPGDGVIVNSSGLVKSVYVGQVSYDMNKRYVNVVNVKEKQELRARDRVVAEVKDVQEKIAVARAFVKLPDKPLKHRRTGVLLGRRNEQMEDVVGIGDIAVLEVASIYRGLITFDIYKPGCGVVLAFCSVCRRPLEKKDQLLFCGKCGSRERRKTVLKYGNDQLLRELVSTAW